MAAAGDDAAQREHRGVRRQDGELAPGRSQLEPPVECLLERGDDFDPVASSPP